MADMFYTVDEVAAALRLSDMTIYRLIKQGKLRAVTIGKRSIRIPESALQAYLERSKVTPDNMPGPDEFGVNDNE